uniref:Putative plant transposon protein domain-containing protein n=1 Tax=Medicago truncatula TaxID=3880 RepID=A2Q2P5_MEDTR|nr:hypothetical protein MtrDRAFT_AC151524g44v2 [Medicago truncatula]
MLTDRKWDELLSPPTLIDPDIVKEFNANVVPECDKMDMDAQFSYTTYVRGQTILFDRDTINAYLGNLSLYHHPRTPQFLLYVSTIEKMKRRSGTTMRL